MSEYSGQLFFDVLYRINNILRNDLFLFPDKISGFLELLSIFQ